jgi:hypothetical protein
MSTINLQNLAKHQETVLTEIRKNEATLVSSEYLTLFDIQELWERQHKLTNTMLWLQNVAKSVQDKIDSESRIVKPTNGHNMKML